MIGHIGRLTAGVTQTLAMAAILSIAPAARAVDLAVAFGEGSEGSTVSLPVSASDPSAVAALACTITYDTQSLDVTVRSRFFDTFARQYAADSVTGPVATEVSVGNVKYIQPLVTTPIAGKGVAVAGVRRAPMVPGATEPLLVLDVALKPGATLGRYGIGVEPTVVRHAGAGYDPNGEVVNILVGRDPAAGTFPVLMPAVGAALHLVPGQATFLAADVDSDGDGLPDWWEREQFGDLNTASASSDSDGDGQPDVVECFMGTDPNSADSIGLLSGRMDGDVYRVYFPVRTGHGMDFAMQHSLDMKTWSESDVTYVERPELGSGEGWVMMEASIPTNGARQLFSRLRLAVPAPGDLAAN